MAGMKRLKIVKELINACKKVFYDTATTPEGTRGEATVLSARGEKGR